MDDEDHPTDDHAHSRDRKRRRAMPLHGKGYVRLMQEQLLRRVREAEEGHNDGGA